MSAHPSPVSPSISSRQIHLLSAHPSPVVAPYLSPVGTSIFSRHTHLLSTHPSPVDIFIPCRHIQPPFHLYTEVSHLLSTHPSPVDSYITCQYITLLSRSPVGNPSLVVISSLQIFCWHTHILSANAPSNLYIQ